MPFDEAAQAIAIRLAEGENPEILKKELVEAGLPEQGAEELLSEISVQIQNAYAKAYGRVAFKRG